VIATAHDELVAVNGIAREVHDPLAGRIIARERSKDGVELSRADRRGEQSDEQSPTVHHVARGHWLDARAYSRSFDVALGQGEPDLLDRHALVNADLGAQHQRTSDRDLRDVAQRGAEFVE